MTKAIYFDMDGTIADLYGVDGWLTHLQGEETFPYEVARPMYDMDALNSMLIALIAKGYTIGVISWSAKGGSAEFNRATRKAKKEWLACWLPCVQEFHCVKYGTPKHKVRKIEDSILIDDNADVRAAWVGETVDATKNILTFLAKTLDKAA